MDVDIQNKTKCTYSYANNIPCENLVQNIIINKSNDELLLNPVIIIELDDTLDLEFDVTDIFNSIELYIENYQIDMFSKNQLKIYQTIKGFEIKKIDSKIFYPLPFNLFGNKISNYLFNKIKLSIFYTSNPCISDIKNICVKTDVVSMKTNLNIEDSKNMDESTIIKDFLEIDTYQITKIKQNLTQEMEGLSTHRSNQKIMLNFNNHNPIDKFFIYFEDTTNDTIYKLRPFDKIIFFINGNTVLEYDYETLIYDNDEKNIGYNLPKGVYQIDWNKFSLKNLSPINNFIVKLCGISIPNNNIVFCICAIQ